MQLREQVLKSNITRAQRLILDNGLQGQMDLVAAVVLRKLAPTTPPPSLDVLTEDGQALSTVLLRFLQSPEASLLVTGSNADIAQAALISQHCQWAYFAQHKQLAPVMVDLAQLADPLHHALPQTLWQAGYTADEMEAFTQGHPGLVVMVTNWDAGKHCTNLWSRNHLHRWGTVAGAAPKVVYFVGDEQLPDGLTATTELYFVAANGANEPELTSLQHVSLAGPSSAAPVRFKGDLGLHEASTKELSASKSDNSDKVDKTSTQAKVDVDQLFQRAARTVHIVRLALSAFYPPAVFYQHAILICQHLIGLLICQQYTSYC
jgi:hypothetical protein